MELSIIIVNYNTKDITRACLASLAKWREGGDWEIIMVDNGSTDGSIEMFKEFPKMKVILNKKNLGFAKANNKGIKIAKSKYILLLNSDTEVRQDSIQTMLRFMDGHLKAGAASCKLILTTGAMDPACHRGFPTPWASFSYLSGLEKLFPNVPLFAGYHLGYKNMAIPHQVDCISGAFFIARREAIDEVGLLDEDYFFYAEDIDWAYRFKKAGWEIWFNPEAVVLHKKKMSGRNSLLRSRAVTTEIYFHTYNWLFFKKHYAEKVRPAHLHPRQHLLLHSFIFVETIFSMKIGIDARLMNETGVGRYIRNLIAELEKIDTKNTYVLFLRKKDFVSYKTRFEKRLTDVPWHSFAEQLFMPAIFSREHLDFLHVPYFNVPLFYFGKCIVTIHDLTILHFDTGKATTLPYILYKLKRFAYYVLLLKAIHWSEKIIAVSHSTKQEILDHFDVLPEHIKVIYEG